MSGKVGEVCASGKDLAWTTTTCRTQPHMPALARRGRHDTPERVLCKHIPLSTHTFFEGGYLHCLCCTRRALQEAEVTRLSGIEAVVDRLRGQLAAADASLSERDSAVQLLTADKAYLNKELQVRSRDVAEYVVFWQRIPY